MNVHNINVDVDVTPELAEQRYMYIIYTKLDISAFYNKIYLCSACETMPVVGRRFYEGCTQFVHDEYRWEIQ